ncbi:MAG: short-subunit dehydrogenase [Saprospiraceae bacterium]|jgi:short-subunit dehydrogenase
MNVIITGGTKGIGRAIAELLHEKGADLAICARNQKDLDEMSKVLTSENPSQQVLTFQCDVSVKEEVINFASFVLSKWNEIDILINNAGVFLPGNVSEEEDGMLEKMIDTNLYSAYHLTRQLLPSMIAKKSGYIFNMCSVASLKAYPNGGSYSISKFALLGFSKVLREELKEKGIKVTSILPGATWSDSWTGIDLPKARLMEANDIAIAVWQAIQMSPSAVVEEILLRPQLGDL